MPFHESNAANERGLVASLRQFTSDVIEYGEARVRLFQAQVRQAVGDYGQAALLAAASLVLVFLAYLPFTALMVLLLARNLFSGDLVPALTVVTLLHLGLAFVCGWMAHHRWKRQQPSRQRSPRAPLPRPDYSAERAWADS